MRIKSAHIIRKNIHYLLMITALLMQFSAAAQKDTTRYWEFSLEKLLNTDITTASKYNQKMTDVPASVKIITEEEIKGSAYQTLDDVLADLPGFQFRNIQGFNSYIFLRGLPNQNNYILLMIDGIQINEINSGGFYGGAQYNLNNVKQIEIIYGPASAVYGTNAVSGVINIITKDPKGNKGLNLNTGFGSFNTFSLDGNYSFYDEQKKLGFSFASMYKHTNKMELGGNAGDNNWSNSMENFEMDNSADARFYYKNFTAGINYITKQASRTTSFKSIGTNYSDKGSIWNQLFLNAYCSFSHDFSEKLKFTGKLYLRETIAMPNSVTWVLKSDSTSTGDQAGNFRPNFLTGIELQLNYFPTEKFQILSGTNMEYEEISNGMGWSHSFSETVIPPYPDRPEILSNKVGSIYMNSSYKLFNKVNLTAGARYDQSSVYNSVLTPRAGIVSAFNKLTLKAAYAEAFRAPKNWDYTDGNGNPGLKPEKMQSMEISAMYRLLKDLDYEIALFHNNLFNGLIKNTVSNRWENQSKIIVNGAEGSIRYSISKFKLFANYTFTRSTGDDGKQIPEIAVHTYNAGVMYWFTKQIGWELKGNYTGDKRNNRIITATGNEYVDGAFVLNSSLNFFNIRNFDFSAGINNILDEKYYHTSNTTVERYRQTGRFFFIKMTFHPKM